MEESRLLNVIGMKFINGNHNGTVSEITDFHENCYCYYTPKSIRMIFLWFVSVNLALMSHEVQVEYFSSTSTPLFCHKCSARHK